MVSAESPASRASATDPDGPHVSIPSTIHFSCSRGASDATHSMTQRKSNGRGQTGNKGHCSRARRMQPENPVLWYQLSSRIPQLPSFTNTKEQLWPPPQSRHPHSTTPGVRAPTRGSSPSRSRWRRSWRRSTPPSPTSPCRTSAGTLSASQDEATWVLTSYLVANAMVLPISGWIANRIGRKRFYMSLRLPLHRCLAALRHRADAGHAGLLPRPAGGSRRRPPAQRAGHPRRHLPPREAQHGLRDVRRRRGDWRRPSAPPSAAGSSTTTPGAGSSSSTSRSASSRSILTNRLVEDPPYLAEIRKRREGIDYWGLGCSSSPSARCRSCSTRARKTTGSARASSSRLRVGDHRPCAVLLARARHRAPHSRPAALSRGATSA